jgi:acyl-CoA thioesterase-1
MRLKFASAFALLLASASAIAAAAPQTATPAAVLVFGDSLTAGNKLPAADRARLWLRQVERDSAGKLALVNAGKGGRPTASVPDFETALARHPEAAALALMLGTNDSRDTSARCVPNAVANLSAMTAHARATRGKNFPLLLIAPPNINPAALGATKPIAAERAANLRAFADAFRALAGEQNTRFASLHGLLPPETLAKDGVHPDASGNDLIAAALLPELLALVQPPAAGSDKSQVSSSKNPPMAAATPAPASCHLPLDTCHLAQSAPFVLEDSAVRLEWRRTPDGWALASLRFTAPDGSTSPVPNPSGRHTLLFSATKPDETPRPFAFNGAGENFPGSLSGAGTDSRWLRATTPAMLNTAGDARHFLPATATVGPDLASGRGATQGRALQNASAALTFHHDTPVFPVELPAFGHVVLALDAD